MVITLYKNYSDDKVTTKNLQEPKLKSVTRKDSWTIENPSFTIGLDDNDGLLLGYNYCYIDTFKRYYFCTITLLNGGMALVSCNVDPLTSFADGVRNLTAYVDRQEFNYNPYTPDPLVGVSQGSVVTAVKVAKVGSTRTLYLTCVGGMNNEE